MVDQKYDDFWAGGFLYDRDTNSVFLHKRDGNTQINPHKWSFFGGQNEGGESLVECFIREIAEEIGLRLEPADVKPLRKYMYEEAEQYRAVFYVETAVPVEQLTLGEGAGFSWFKLSEINQLDLTDKAREDLHFFARQRK